jgi:hypothetical protein
MLFSGKWMDREIIVLSQISQLHEDKYLMFPIICGGEGKRKEKPRS